MKRFAEETAVPVDRSRREIDKLLESWGAEGVQWTNDFRTGSATLRFVWSFTHEGRALPLQARFDIRLPSDAELWQTAVDGRTNKPSTSKFDKLKEARGRTEHRVLLLWLKGALNAIDTGLVTPEVLLLPFLERADGSTVGAEAVKVLGQLRLGSPALLLGAGAPQER